MKQRKYVNMILPDNLYEVLAKVAKRNKRSLRGEAVTAIEEYIRRKERKGKHERV